jgi:hypothetical protein
VRVAVITLLCLLALTAGSQADPHHVDRIDDIQQELDSLTEDVEDLREPVGEFDLFEECMYVIGVAERGGYVYERRGRTTPRTALAFDIRGFGRPKYHLLAFPGEEPPSIECNEDAGQEDIDD